MKIILASSNKGKIDELKKMMPNVDIVPFNEILGKVKIVEDGNSFKENAIKKAKLINEKLVEKKFKNFLVISDDSGISVPIFGNEPGIYSARYSKIGASDKENNEKLISKLNEKNLSEAKAFYTASMTIIYKGDIYTVHGWMHGKIINKEIGTNGFGYDPMFIPEGYRETLGELSLEIKKEFSHRSKALNLIKLILEVINPNLK